MDIGPVNNPLPQQQPNKKRLENELPEKSQDTGAADRVEISLEARRRLSELAEQARASETDSQKDRIEEPNGQERTNNDIPEKAGSMDEIRKRIESGYYDRSDVMDQIADKLSDDIET